MSDFIGDRECITHHHACDCREEKFAKMEKNLTAKDERIAELEGALEKICYTENAETCLDIATEALTARKAMNNE